MKKAHAWTTKCSVFIAAGALLFCTTASSFSQVVVNNASRDLLLGETGRVQLIFSDSNTSRITRPLASAVSQCSKISAEYRVSCVAQAYRDAARKASQPDYANARAELNKAAQKLSGLVSKNADPNIEPLRKNRKKYVAIKPSSVSKVNRQAVNIISETETKLLRSSGSGARKTHYQRIAQAVGSTKKILRS